MTKLLQGKSLYIAKHMHGQLIHADVDDHTDPRPTTTLAPCVSACTTGYQLIDFSNINLWCGHTPGFNRTGERIGKASYIFHDIPPTFEPCYLGTSQYGWKFSFDRNIDTFHKLATLHWFKCWLSFSLHVNIGPFFYQHLMISPFEPGCTATAAGDTYHGIFTLDIGGIVDFSVGFVVPDPRNLVYHPHIFLCPAGARLALYGGTWGYSYPIWTGGRNADGSYY